MQRCTSDWLSTLSIVLQPFKRLQLQTNSFLLQITQSSYCIHSGFLQSYDNRFLFYAVIIHLDSSLRYKPMFTCTLRRENQLSSYLFPPKEW